MGTAEPKINVIGACWHYSTGRQKIYQEMVNLETALNIAAEIKNRADGLGSRRNWERYIDG